MGQSTEIWKPVVGYEGIYEVSNFGRVKALPRTVIRSNGRPCSVRECIRSASPNHKGYLKVTLWKDRKLRTRTVHTLVLEAFVGPRPAGHVCRHLNGDPADPRLENLAWGTPVENMADRYDHGTSPSLTRKECKRGHAFAGPNLFIDSRGRRVCRACKREFKSAQDHKRPFSNAMADLQYSKIMAA